MPNDPYVEAAIAFKKIMVHDVDGYEDDIRAGKDRALITDKILNGVLNRITKEDLKYLNYINLTKYFDVVKEAVDKFDPDKGYALGQQINGFLKESRNQKKLIDTMYTGETENNQKNSVKSLSRFKKAIRKAGYLWENMSNDDIIAFGETIGLSEKQVKGLLSIDKVINPDSLSRKINDGDVELMDIIPDMQENGEDNEISVVIKAFLYDTFSRIVKNTKEKKLEIVFMQNSNIVGKMKWNIADFKEFVDKLYTEYADQYEKYENVDIIYYKWFDGKRQGDDGFPQAEFMKKKSSFSHTYAKPYKTMFAKCLKDSMI
ncbi:MAG: hypothetical protein ACI4DY_01920 [Monoglobaceae bacterium]